MAIYKRNHMLFKDYRWTTYLQGDSRIAGVPDKTVFNPREGYEVLYLINQFAYMYQLMTVTACKKLEWKLHEKLPPYIRTQIEVCNWLYNNWSL